MRLLHTFNNDRHARTFSAFLIQKGIESQLDIKPITDWGSPEYGNLNCNVWVIDEDDLDKAHEYLKLYLENPQDPKFEGLKPAAPPNLLPVEKPFFKQEPQRQSLAAPKPTGTITFYLILICTLFFFAAQMTSYPTGSPPENLPVSALYSSTIKQNFFYDYPKAFEIIDKLVKAYGFEALTAPNKLPEEGRYLLQQYAKTPYWQGFYDKMVSLFKQGKPITIDAPMFEKIREGQVWRLFTPCVLHAGLFHLFFNMMWLLVLGKQMEERLKVGRYLLFILITGIFSNTAQYLMSGSNFIGFSGVLCAMIVFVWYRQKAAPREGYQILPATMTFITIFILAFAGFSLISFFFEIAGKGSIAPPIANTAHLSGGLAGYLLARLNFFATPNDQK